MTTPAFVTRDDFDEYRKAHHDAMNTLAKTSESMNLKVDRIYDMLAGTFERPGMVHRLADVEAAQVRHERITPEEQRALWWKERATKVVDAVAMLLVISILVLAAKAFILDTVRDLATVQSPRGTMIPVERDPTTRIAFIQENTP